MSRSVPAKVLGAAVVLVSIETSFGQTNDEGDGRFKEFIWRPIGPINMAGRIDDIEAVESDPHIVYVGAATGGVWKTTNNGTTWAPIFDDQPNLSIGDIAIAPSNPNILWVGTGEPNNRQSSSYGAGVFESLDGGGTWTFAGLGDSGAIGRIVIDPKDPNVVYVAAVGISSRRIPSAGCSRRSMAGRHGPRASTWMRTQDSPRS